MQLLQHLNIQKTKTSFDYSISKCPGNISFYLFNKNTFPSLLNELTKRRKKKLRCCDISVFSLVDDYGHAIRVKHYCILNWDFMFNVIISIVHI